MNWQHEIEPYWKDDDNWLCTVELLPSDDPETRPLAAQTSSAICLAALS
jgi:hypothetical protein